VRRGLFARQGLEVEQHDGVEQEVTPGARVGVDHLEVKLAVGVGRQVNQQGAERLVISAAESGELPTGGIAQGQADSARRAAADLENQEAARAAAERRRARVGDGGIAALRIIGRKPALAFRLCDGALVGAGPSHAASTRTERPMVATVIGTPTAPNSATSSTQSRLV
jgi:hypothetical protein